MHFNQYFQVSTQGFKQKKYSFLLLLLVRVLKFFTFWGFRFLRYHNGSKEHPNFFLWYFYYKRKCFFLKYFLPSVTSKKSQWFAICIYNCQIGHFDSKRNLLITRLDILATKKIFIKISCFIVYLDLYQTNFWENFALMIYSQLQFML